MFLGLTALGILVAIYQLFYIYEYTHVVFMQNTYLYLLLGIFLSMIFIMTPANKKASPDRVPWYDVILFLLILV